MKGFNENVNKKLIISQGMGELIIIREWGCTFDYCNSAKLIFANFLCNEVPAVYFINGHLIFSFFKLIRRILYCFLNH